MVSYPLKFDLLTATGEVEMKIIEMNKELLTVEFRYPNYWKDKTVTIGIFDTIEEAIVKGNECLKELQVAFPMKRNELFELNHLWGQPRRLVLGEYKQVRYFAKITALHFDDLTASIADSFAADKLDNPDRFSEDDD